MNPNSLVLICKDTFLEHGPPIWSHSYVTKNESVCESNWGTPKIEVLLLVSLKVQLPLLGGLVWWLEVRE